METIDARKFFILITKGMDLLSQKQIADSLDLDSGMLNKYIKGKGPIKGKIRKQLEDNSAELIKVILKEAEQRESREAVIKNLCFEIAQKYSLLPITFNGLMSVYNLNYEKNEELEKCFEENFKRLLNDLSTSKDSSGQNQAKYNIPEECVITIQKLMESFKSGVYLLKSERNEEMEMFIERGIYTRHIKETRVYCNPKKEEFPLTIRRNFERKELLNNSHQGDLELLNAPEAAAKKFRNLKILINNTPLTDYVCSYIHKFPSKAKKYKSIENFINNGTNDIYWLFERGDNTKNNPGKAKMAIYLKLQIPMDYSQEELEVIIDYTSDHTLVVPGDGYIYRTPYPCKRLYHTFSIKPEEQWTLEIFPFEAFYNIGELSIQGKGSRTEREGATATIDMNHWILPGMGYMRRYYYCRNSFVDAYRPEFLTFTPPSKRTEHE